jgi:hypothetical protein
MDKTLGGIKVVLVVTLVMLVAGALLVAVNVGRIGSIIDRVEVLPEETQDNIKVVGSGVSESYITLTTQLTHTEMELYAVAHEVYNNRLINSLALLLLFGSWIMLFSVLVELFNLR